MKGAKRRKERRKGGEGASGWKKGLAGDPGEGLQLNSFVSLTPREVTFFPVVFVVANNCKCCVMKEQGGHLFINY